MVKVTITALLLLITTAALASRDYIILPIGEVYDGDTIKTTINKLPAPLNRISIRILGIDTPEMPAKSYATTGRLGRSRCVREAELAIKAKARVAELLANNTEMIVSNYAWGKYGGRIVASVSVDGVDIATDLINRGLAVSYDGGTKIKDWCAI